jgi:hypothetical protein
MRIPKFKILVFILSIILIQACSKENAPPPTFPLPTNLTIKNVTRSSAIINSLVTEFYPPIQITASGFCYATTQNPTTSNSVVNIGTVIYAGSINTDLNGLQPNTTYYVRWFVTSSEGTRYSEQISFKTLIFYIDYGKYYNVSNDRYWTFTQVFSIENGTHTIYGEGFSTTAIDAKMISVSNDKDYVIPTVTVIDDNTLTIKIPEDMLSQNPYIESKEYYLLLNNIYFRSVYDVADGIDKSHAIFVVANKDLNISRVDKPSSPCGSSDVFAGRTDIHGQFGSLSTYNPSSLSFAFKKNRQLSVKVDGVYYKTYIVPDDSKITSCGNAYIIKLITNPQWLTLYHNSFVILLVEDLPKGLITLQVENIMSDGTIVTSNESSFAN